MDRELDKTDQKLGPEVEKITKAETKKPAWKLTEAEMKEETKKWETYWFQRSKTGYPIETVKAGIALRAARKAYLVGFQEGLFEYAWMKDGVYYVGTTGKTYREALKEFLDSHPDLPDPQRSSESKIPEKSQSS